MAFERLALWEFIPEVVVQVSSIVLFAIVALAMIVGISRMTRSIANAAHLSISSSLSNKGGESWWKAAWVTLWHQVFGHEDYREDECEEDQARLWFVQKWFAHATILYGFVGLFGATALNFLFKPVGSWVPIYYPMRLLGTVSGILLMYGTTLALVHRLQKRDKYAAHSQTSDWMLLSLIWFIGLTGFLLEIAAYSRPPATWAYPFLILHVALVMDLLVMLPLSKFAHIVYRTIAIYMHNRGHKDAIEKSPIAAAST